MALGNLTFSMCQDLIVDIHFSYHHDAHFPLTNSPLPLSLNLTNIHHFCHALFSLPLSLSSNLSHRLLYHHSYTSINSPHMLLPTFAPNPHHPYYPSSTLKVSSPISLSSIIILNPHSKQCLSYSLFVTLHSSPTSLSPHSPLYLTLTLNFHFVHTLFTGLYLIPLSI